MNIDARCERSPADKHVHEREVDDGECMGSPINRKIFMAVERKRIEDTSTSTLSLLTKHASLASVSVQLSDLVAALSPFPVPPSSRRVFLSLSFSLCCDAIVKGSTCHRVRSNRASCPFRVLGSSIHHAPRTPQTCLLPDAPLESSPWFLHLKARQTSNLYLKSLVPLQTHGLSASRSYSGSIKGGGYNARDLTEFSRERLTSQARLEQLSIAVFTPSRGGPRCGSIFLGTLHLSRDLKRWR